MMSAPKMPEPPRVPKAAPPTKVVENSEQSVAQKKKRQGGSAVQSGSLFAGAANRLPNSLF